MAESDYKAKKENLLYVVTNTFYNRNSPNKIQSNLLFLLIYLNVIK